MPVWQPGATTLQDAAAANGNGTVLDVAGFTGFALQVVGTFSATVNFEGTLDGTNWVALEVENEATGALSTTATAVGYYSGGASGLVSVRARVSGYASGSVTVTGRPTAAGGGGGTGDADTELPAAVALGDDTATPTAPAVGAFAHVWDGTGWDRAPGDAEQGADVDVTRSALPDGAATAANQDSEITELQAANASLDAIEADTDATRIAVQALDTEVDVALSTRASLAEQETQTTALTAANASLDAIEASASVLDDWDEADRAKVNPIAGQAGVEGGAGAVTALTQRVALATDANVVQTLPSVPAAGDILHGHLATTVSTAATTLVTVPAGETWVGVVGISCDVAVAAASSTAGQSLGVISISGAGATPPAGDIFGVEARAGANAATGTVGSNGANANSMPLTVVADAGAAALIQITTTQAGTASRVDAWASGRIVS